MATVQALRRRALFNILCRVVVRMSGREPHGVSCLCSWLWRNVPTIDDSLRGARRGPSDALKPACYAMHDQYKEYLNR